MINRVFDPALTIDDVEWLRGAWPGKLVIKGVQSVDDALRVVDAGADGVLLSNHGGRQLDRAPVPLELVEPTVQALGGRAEVLVDTGVTNGGDVVAAVALGASAALVGRAYLYGLMAGGRAGVAKVAEILRADIVRTLQLLGVTSVDELGPQHVRLRKEPMSVHGARRARTARRRSRPRRRGGPPPRPRSGRRARWPGGRPRPRIRPGVSPSCAAARRNTSGSGLRTPSAGPSTTASNSAATAAGTSWASLTSAVAMPAARALRTTAAGSGPSVSTPP